MVTNLLFSCCSSASWCKTQIICLRKMNVGSHNYGTHLLFGSILLSLSYTIGRVPKNAFPGVTGYLGHVGKHGTDALAKKGRQMISLYHLPLIFVDSWKRRSKIPEKRFGEFGATVGKKKSVLGKEKWFGKISVLIWVSLEWDWDTSWKALPYLALNSRKHWWGLQGNEAGEVEGRRKSTQDAFSIKLDLGGRGKEPE